jgi:hypothetical protein
VESVPLGGVKVRRHFSGYEAPCCRRSLRMAARTAAPGRAPPQRWRKPRTHLRLITVSALAKDHCTRRWHLYGVRLCSKAIRGAHCHTPHVCYKGVRWPLRCIVGWCVNVHEAVQTASRPPLRCRSAVLSEGGPKPHGFHEPPLALTVDHAAGRYPIVLQVAAAAQHAFQVLIRAEGAPQVLDAPRGLNRRPVEGKGRRDDAITVWGADPHRPAFAPLRAHRLGAQSDMPAALEATIPPRAGESAPAEQAQHA